MRYFIELSYNGKDYHGWQIQPNAISVQEVLENALTTILRQDIGIVGAGRTDAGVHATQIFAHFDSDIELNTDDVVYKLNSILPKSIAVQQVFRVTDDAHARFHATKRSYQYKIITAKNPFLNEYAYLVKQPLAVDKMNQAASILLEYENFKCFSKVKTDVHTYNCTITFAEWSYDNGQLVFSISADRFLRNMVRAIVGTLLYIGLGKLEVDAIHDIIKSENRGEAGVSVPAHGLYLTEVCYPDTIIYGN
ncbi:MAG: tRNA pseudouridine(38-40) synthase TruA [Flavobacteriaceae bacterium]